MQDKTNLVHDLSASIGLSSHSGMSIVLRINTRNEAPILLRGEALDEVDSFTYLGSMVTKDGGTEAGIAARIGKARAAFKQLKNVWRFVDLSRKTKIRIFNSNVKSVLYYGSETWRTSVTNSNKLQTFFNSCLRQNLHIRWPEVINEMLWECTDQTPVDQQLIQRRWRWIGHTLHKPTSNTTRQALRWNPQGKRRRGGPRNTWQRDLVADAKKAGYAWGELEQMAQDRGHWKQLVDGLCPRRGNRP